MRWIKLTIAAALVLALGYLLLAPRQFGFINRLNGKKATPSPLIEAAIADMEKRMPPKQVADARAEQAMEEAKVETYVFQADPQKVLRAMTDELESCGWTSDRDPMELSLSGSSSTSYGRVTFRNHGDVAAMFSSNGDALAQYVQPATCIVMVPHSQSLFAKLLPAIKNPF